MSDEFAQSLAREDDPAAVRLRILSRLQSWARCRTGLFFEQLESDGAYSLAESSGLDTHVSIGPFAARRGLARWLRVNNLPLFLRRDREVFEHLPDEDRKALIELGVEVCVPLIVDSRLLGFVLLAGIPATPVPVGDERTFAQLCQTAAVACERVVRHQLERERLAAAAKAQQLAIAGQLASAMAHEVRNPLTTIRSSVQFVMSSTSDWPKKLALLGHVVEEVDRINRAVSGMLGLARPQNVELVALDWAGEIRATVTMFQPHLEHLHIALEDELRPEELLVYGDPGQLRQVLTNILLNACQAMPSGGRVTISSQTDNGRATVSITDVGVGMSDSEITQAFEPFFTTKSTGTGLGLPICREIMTKHDGEIRVQSEKGRGTTVLLSLPLRAV